MELDQLEFFTGTAHFEFFSGTAHFELKILLFSFRIMGITGWGLQIFFNGLATAVAAP